MLKKNQPPSAATTLQYAFVALCMAAVMLAITLILVGLLLFFLVGSELLRFTKMFLPALMALLMGIFGIVAHRVVFLAVGHRNTIFHAAGVSYATTVLPFCVAANLITAVGIIATLVVQSGHIEEYEGRIFKSMVSYNSITYSKVLMDDLQVLLQCCGANGYQDYFSIDWAGTDVLPYDDSYHEELERSHVPFSCCKTNILKPCLQNDLMGAGLDTINQEGCAPALVEQRSLVALIMAILFLSMGIMQIGQVCFSRTMVDPELPTADSVVCHEEKVEKQESKPDTSTKALLPPKDLLSTTVSGDISSASSQTPGRKSEKQLKKITEGEEMDLPKASASDPIKQSSAAPLLIYPYSAKRMSSARYTPSRKRPNTPKNVADSSENTTPHKHPDSEKVSPKFASEPSVIDKTSPLSKSPSSPRYRDTTEKTTPIFRHSAPQFHPDTTKRTSITSSNSVPQEYPSTTEDTSTISLKYTSSETESLITGEYTPSKKHTQLADDQVETTVPETSSDVPTDITGINSTPVESDSNTPTGKNSFRERYSNTFRRKESAGTSQTNTPVVAETGQSDESDSLKFVRDRQPSGWNRNFPDDEENEEEQEEISSEGNITSKTENTHESHDEDVLWKPFQIPPGSSSEIPSDDPKTFETSDTKPSDTYDSRKDQRASWKDAKLVLGQRKADSKQINQ